MINMTKGRDKQRKLVLGIGSVVLAVAIGVMLLVPQDKVNNAPELKIPVKEAFAALFRHLKTDEICYEPSRNAYFVSFPDTEELGDWGGKWYLLKEPAFHHIPSNGTWFTEDFPSDSYTQVWPDVSKLECAKDPDYQAK